MFTAIVVSVVVIAVIAGGVLGLLKSKRAGMPSRDVLDRAKRRARELDKEADR
jgi:hypothetical protein